MNYQLNKKPGELPSLTIDFWMQVYIIILSLVCYDDFDKLTMASSIKMSLKYFLGTYLGTLN